MANQDSALVELAPDTVLRVDHVRRGRRGVLSQLTYAGTRDGAPYEMPFIIVTEVDARGAPQRNDLYDPEQIDQAFARFEELRPDPLRIPPNAATRATDRWEAAIAVADLETIQALYPPENRFDDRRRLLRTTGGVDESLITDQLLAEEGWRMRRTLLATAGDRLSLEHILFMTGDAGAQSEIETLAINEVDREGKFVANVVFDPDDGTAARMELLERWVAQGPLPPVAIELTRAWNEHDLERTRALLPAEFYVDDRRRTGVGRLEGADAFVDWIAAGYELSPDVRFETLYNVAAAEHGALSVCRWFGTNTVGGEFDAVYVMLTRFSGDTPVGVEYFELDDLDAARARFAVLGAAQTPA